MPRRPAAGRSCGATFFALPMIVLLPAFVCLHSHHLVPPGLRTLPPASNLVGQLPHSATTGSVGACGSGPYGAGHSAPAVDGAARRQRGGRAGACGQALVGECSVQIACSRVEAAANAGVQPVPTNHQPELACLPTPPCRWRRRGASRSRARTRSCSPLAARTLRWSSASCSPTSNHSRGSRRSRQMAALRQRRRRQGLPDNKGQLDCLCVAALACGSACVVSRPYLQPFAYHSESLFTLKARGSCTQEGQGSTHVDARQTWSQDQERLSCWRTLYAPPPVVAPQPGRSTLRSSTASGGSSRL